MVTLREKPPRGFAIVKRANGCGPYCSQGIRFTQKGALALAKRSKGRVTTFDAYMRYCKIKEYMER